MNVLEYIVGIIIVIAAAESLHRLINRRSPQKPTDPFLENIVISKQQADALVMAATQHYERDLEDRFSTDLKLKEGLSQFAKLNELDEALIALWEEVKRYPACTNGQDFGKVNRLEVSDVEEAQQDKIKSVSFIREGHRYTVSMQEEPSFIGSDINATFSLGEDKQEVFTISCAVSHSEYGTTYSCHSITAFRKQGNWAKMLIDAHRRIRLSHNKASANLKYSAADKIRERFQG